jgi:uroporphyrin-3 C-methyltransferase
VTDKPNQPEDANKADSSAAASGQPEAGQETTANAPEDASPEQTATAPESKPNKKRKARPEKSGRGGGWGLGLLFLILVAGLGALGYYQWQHQQNFEATVARLNGQVEEQLNRIAEANREAEQAEQAAARAAEQVSQLAEERQQQVRQFQQQTSQLQDQLQQQLEQRNRELQQQLNGLRQQIQAITTTTTDDWKLAEAYYLTRLAGQRLLMERDTESALALLQSADRIVRNYPDPNLFPVREALADDIAELKLAGDVDREGIYLQIAAMSRQLTELNMAEPRNFEPEADVYLPPAEPEPTDEETGWWHSVRQSFARALQRMEDFVRVTRHDTPVQPLMAPAQQLQLRSSVQTALDTAQLALMREQPAVYQTSLEKARELINRFYVESSERSRILADLQALENTEIRQDLPDIAESQEALGNYLDQRHRLAPDEGRDGAQTDSGAN